MMKVEYRPWINCKDCPHKRELNNSKIYCRDVCYGKKNPIIAELIESGTGCAGDRSIIEIYGAKSSVPTEQLQLVYDRSFRKNR